MTINYPDIYKFDFTKMFQMSTKDESSTQLMGELVVLMTHPLLTFLIGKIKFANISVINEDIKKIIKIFFTS